MAAEIRQFNVTVPAGTAIAAPQVSSLAMPARIVDLIRIRVPPGPRGAVGFAFGMAGTRIIPFNAGAYVVADDEVLEWPLSGQPDSGAWQLFAYNLGANDHTLYITFHLELPQSRAAVALAPPLIITA
jgi:hypothetical protein